MPNDKTLTTNKQKVEILMSQRIPTRFISAKLGLSIAEVSSLKWQIKNPDKYKELKKKYRNDYRKKHPEKRKEYEANYIKNLKKLRLEKHIEKLNNKLKDLEND